MPYLVKFDAPGIHGYVFGEDVLKQVRGASALVDTLSRETAKKLSQKHNGTIVFLGGGGGAVDFEHEHAAQAFCAELTAAYRQLAPGLAFQIATDTHPSGQQLSEQLARLDDALSQQAPLVSRGHVLTGYMRRCTSCRQQPAAHAVYERRLCDICNAKYNYLGKDGSGERPFLNTFEAFLKTTNHRHKAAWQTVLNILAKDAQPQDAGAEPRTRWETVLPETLMDIGEMAHRPGYFAMLYADGNRMGNAIRDFLGSNQGNRKKAAQSYFNFSNDLANAIEQATFKALLDCIPIQQIKLPGCATKVATPLIQFASQQQVDKHGNKPATRYILPFEILLLGGDDLVIMLQPELALPFSLSLQEHFRDEIKNIKSTAKEVRKLSLGVGFVIAPYTTPMRRLFSNAETLLNSAKRKAFQMEKEQKNFAGALDWLTLTSDSNHELDAYRSSHFQLHETVSLTERPFSYKEGMRFQQLLTKTQNNQNLALGPLQAIAESCRESQQKANVNLLHLLGRLEPKARGALTLLLNDMVHQQPSDRKLTHSASRLEDQRIHPGREDQIPFYKQANSEMHTTGLLDLLELLPFQPNTKEANP